MVEIHENGKVYEEYDEECEYCRGTGVVCEYICPQCQGTGTIEVRDLVADLKQWDEYVTGKREKYEI